MMANEALVVLDLSGVVAIDSAGLEATIRFMDAIQAFGGSLRIGRDSSPADGATKSITVSERRLMQSIQQCRLAAEDASIALAQ